MSSRKRSRPISVLEDDKGKSSDHDRTASAPKAVTPGESGAEKDARSQDLKKHKPETRPSVESNHSWYGGTWPRVQKSSASTSIVRETITAGKPKNGVPSSDLGKFESRKEKTLPTTQRSSRPPSMLLGKSRETATVTLPENTGQDQALAAKAANNDETRNTKIALPTGGENTQSGANNTAQPVDTSTETQAAESASPRPSTSSGWLGSLPWLGKPQSEPAKPEPTDVAPPEPDTKDDTSEDKPSVAEADSETQQTTARYTLSWLGSWVSPADRVPSGNDQTSAPQPPPPPQVESSSSPTPPAPSKPPPPKSAEPAPGSSWAFWSTDSTKNPDKASAAVESGELAIAGDASQNAPEPAQAPDSAVEAISVPKEPKKPGPAPVGEKADTSAKVSKEKENTSAAATSSKKAPAAQSALQAKPLPPNLLLPSFHGTYKLAENPSIIQQIARLLMSSQQAPPRHCFVVKDPPKIKRALAIGIHGLFPGALLRTVIGQPTGTSIRFANHAAAAIKRWAEKHMGEVDVEVEKVALEGEGRISERVDNLWKLLLNWIDHVRRADFILVACHSQGVPIAVMLVAKLIQFGVVSTGRIGICAMAGVSLGPFPDYKSTLMSGSTAELFDFGVPDSAVSRAYVDALSAVTKYGARITYIGSIDDQVVSLESSIFSTANHPYIFRAVFVDGRIHAPDFIAHLVGFALKLRNLGVTDHGLIRELSAPLVGSLYTGEGHSRLYDDAQVYDLAVEHALESTSVGDVPLNVQRYEVPTNQNPYLLPWSIRGLLEEDLVKTDLNRETAELLGQFDDWKPSTKVLKDVKFRLEAVRSKL